MAEIDSSTFGLKLDVHNHKLNLAAWSLWKVWHGIENDCMSNEEIIDAIKLVLIIVIELDKEIE